ncbi:MULTISPECIES: HupE/UreJ family protein [unclassified Synechococcus]|uniref:HupE/UreJ family protein n=1 Tax=unclassified Synechococcus TaxID=2626047 RepID=UPI0020CC7655|nr:MULTISPECIES: HupE/UreJ family protein [unclassified Synechococcus]
MVLFELRAPLWLAALIVVAFAVFHSYAHGSELPAVSNALVYSHPVWSGSGPGGPAGGARGADGQGGDHGLDGAALALMGGVAGVTAMTTMLTLMLKEQLGPAHCAYWVRIRRSPPRDKRDQALQRPFLANNCVPAQTEPSVDSGIVR